MGVNLAVRLVSWAATKEEYKARPCHLEEAKDSQAKTRTVSKLKDGTFRVDFPGNSVSRPLRSGWEVCRGVASWGK